MLEKFNITDVIIIMTSERYLKTLIDGLFFRFDTGKLGCFSWFFTAGNLLHMRNGGGESSVELSQTSTASKAFSRCAVIDGSIL